MTFRGFKRAVSAAAAAVCFVSAVPAVPLIASAEHIITKGGYDYEYWSDSDDYLKFDVDEDGVMLGSWYSQSNCFFAKGLIKNKPVSNNYIVNYDVSINFGPVQNASAYGACTYLCAYGTLSDPPAEIFLIDYDSDPEWYNGGGENPPWYNEAHKDDYTPLGSFESDGNIYDLYTNNGVNHTIDGSYNYARYFSVRRGCKMKDRYETNQSWGAVTEYSDYSGSIDVGAHLDAFEKAGKRVGDLERLSFNIESYCSGGEVKLNSCEITEKAEEDTEPIKTRGTFEKDGYNYSYSSSCRPSKINLKIHDDVKSKEFDYSCPDGTNTITKELITEPVKIGKNDVIMFRSDYEFTLKGEDDNKNRFSGILEMELNDAQKVFFADTGLALSEKKIEEMYAEKGITAKPAGKTDGNTIKLRETLFSDTNREMNVYPFTYTIKNGDKEEKHTDYWLTDLDSDTYSYRSGNHKYSGNKIKLQSSYRCYNIHTMTDVFEALGEFGLSAETIESASFVFCSENVGSSISVADISLDVTDFPDGPYDYSVSYYGEGDFSLKSKENGVFDFDWYNKLGGTCFAKAGKRFGGSGLDLADVESITADYSVTVDSVEIYKVDKDKTSVYLYGTLPATEEKTDEFYIDIAYLGNDETLKKRSGSSAPLSAIDDNGKTYDLHSNSMLSDSGYELFVSNIDDELSVDRQYWSMEHEPPVNGEDAASFSGTIDITKHIAEYRALENGNKCGLLSELAIVADAEQSVGNISVDKFDITITYKDGTVEKYTPAEVTKTQKKTVIGDLNGDNRTDSLDLVLMRREVLGAEADKTVNKLADMNGDGQVKLNDLVLLTNFILGKKADKT
ncbi:MAG: glycoside hydrolase family 11 protein [Ruminococcus sp.]|uniref:dockerin type I repeat-containing protein n=1 Tax=Ruminococcus sp. TaxID=41978 RepID=UPI0025EAE234|nr:glycoside hydrolase family 11 protein [Ruminococcus sp.]MBR5683802.1 glycoside hydrolase family 11 protein [Ruminococcus sp.]